LARLRHQNRFAWLIKTGTLATSMTTINTTMSSSSSASSSLQMLPLLLQPLHMSQRSHFLAAHPLPGAEAMVLVMTPSEAT